MFNSVSDKFVVTGTLQLSPTVFTNMRSNSFSNSCEKYPIRTIVSGLIFAVLVKQSLTKKISSGTSRQLPE